MMPACNSPVTSCKCLDSFEQHCKLRYQCWARQRSDKKYLLQVLRSKSIETRSNWDVLIIVSKAEKSVFPNFNVYVHQDNKRCRNVLSLYHEVAQAFVIFCEIQGLLQSIHADFSTPRPGLTLTQYRSFIAKVIQNIASFCYLSVGSQSGRNGNLL